MTTASTTIHDEDGGSITLAPYQGEGGGYALWHRGVLVWRSVGPEIDRLVATANDAYVTAWMTAWTKRFSTGYATAPSFFHEWPKEAQEDQLLCIRAALEAILLPTPSTSEKTDAL